MTMEEYGNKFLEMLRYVKYITGEKNKDLTFLNWNASPIERIMFDELQNMDEATRKDKYCYG